jgi:hypothetical protein
MTYKDPAALRANKQRYYREHREAILAKIKVYQGSRIGRKQPAPPPAACITLQGEFAVTYGACVAVEALPGPHIVTRLRLEGTCAGKDPEAWVGVVPQETPVEALVRYVLARDVRPWREKESA